MALSWIWAGFFVVGFLAALAQWLFLGDTEVLKRLVDGTFDSARVAPSVNVPALVLVGEDDATVPPRLSDRLAALWGGKVERVGFAGFGHNGLALHPGYGGAIRAFLDRCQ